MEALKTKGIAHKGILSVAVPKEFEDKELEVIVLFINNTKPQMAAGDGLKEEEKMEKFHEMSPDKRLKILEQYKGTAKFPDFPISKYDVYNQ